MREIKFRAWGQVDKKMYLVAFPSWNGVVTGKVDFINHEVVEIEQDGDDVPILMQFTGLKDRNGRDIYEGDVVKGQRPIRARNAEVTGEERFIGVVEYDDWWGAFRRKGVKQYQGLSAELRYGKELEVIGNLFEHPELLEAK